MSDIEMRGCPYPKCQSNDHEHDLWVSPTASVAQGDWTTGCACCGMLGPVMPTREQAIEAWNEYPRGQSAQGGATNRYSDGSGYEFTPAKLDDAMSRLATALKTDRKDMRDCGVGLRGGIASLAAHCAGQEATISQLRSELEQAIDELASNRWTTARAGGLDRETPAQYGVRPGAEIHDVREAKTDGEEAREKDATEADHPET